MKIYQTSTTINCNTIHNEMILVVASDIFGRTKKLEALVEDIRPAFKESHIIDPYDGRFMEFSNEDDAYTCFMAETGLTKYSEILHNHVDNYKQPLLLLGFSVGAAALWQISGSKAFKPESKIIGFYGAQIRNLLDIRPTLPVHLYFPAYEDHFSVPKLIDHLSPVENITCHKTAYLHGFMNKLSINFNRQGYMEYIGKIKPDHPYNSIKPCRTLFTR